MKKKSLNFQYWIDDSEKDFQVAKSLFISGYYSHCLFFCHLTIEKFLKAIVVKRTKEYPPYTHDLRRLAEIANLDLNSKQEKILEIISTFNIAGRYADTKLKFY